MFDTMRHVRPDVSTCCIGLAASMGAFILTSGQQVCGWEAGEGGGQTSILTRCVWSPIGGRGGGGGTGRSRGGEDRTA